MTGSSAILFVLLLGSSHPPAQSFDEACLAYTAKREVGFADPRDVKAVVEVVQHRMRKSRKSCKVVVAQKNQFSWWHKGVKMNLTKKELTAFKKARKMRRQLPTCASNFHATTIAPPSWTSKMKRVAVRNGTAYYCGAF